MNKKAKILLYSSNIWYLGEGLLGPLFAVFASRVGGDILDITWAWAIYLIVGGLLQILFGRMSDKISKENFIVWGYSLNTIFTFSYLFVNDPLSLFIVQAGLGVASAMATPTWSALYAENVGKSEKDTGRLWGLADGESDIILGIATFLGGILVINSSFEVLFITMGTIQLIATIYVFGLLKKHRKRTTK